MTKNIYKSCNIIDRKPRWVVVDENGKIVNRNPSKDELKGLVNFCSKFKRHGHKYYTDKELINYLKQFVQENGRIPLRNDFVYNLRYPGYKIYSNRFGSWNNAIRIAEFKTNHGGKHYSNEELINYLKQFVQENGKIPVAIDFVNDPRYPSFRVYQTRFGSWQKALKLVGLDIESLVKSGTIENSQQKGRYSEIIVRDHFKNNPIDLAGENIKSPYDGICPNGKTYDVKSSKFYKDYEHWHFGTNNKDKEEIEIYYFLAFNDDYTKLRYGWRIPGEIVEKEALDVGLSANWEFNIENMKKYDITDKITDILTKKINN